MIDDRAAAGTALTGVANQTITRDTLALLTEWYQHNGRSGDQSDDVTSPDGWTLLANALDILREHHIDGANAVDIFAVTNARGEIAFISPGAENDGDLQNAALERLSSKTYETLRAEAQFYGIFTQNVQNGLYDTALGGVRANLSTYFGSYSEGATSHLIGMESLHTQFPSTFTIQSSLAIAPQFMFDTRLGFGNPVLKTVLGEVGGTGHQLNWSPELASHIDIVRRIGDDVVSVSQSADEFGIISNHVTALPNIVSTSVGHDGSHGPDYGTFEHHIHLYVEDMEAGREFTPANWKIAGQPTYEYVDDHGNLVPLTPADLLQKYYSPSRRSPSHRSENRTARKDPPRSACRRVGRAGQSQLSMTSPCRR